MMKMFFLACMLGIFMPVSAQGNQGGATQSNKEWDALDAVFVSLIEALQKENKPLFKEISLPLVDCIDCVGTPDFNDKGYFVTPDIFFLNVAKNFKKSPVYNALVKRGYTFSISKVKNYKPKFFPKDYPKDLTLYEVWVPTYLVNELSQGHPGTSHSFQFVKINGKFRFYGLTSIP